jgi:hypothetical protein
MLFSSKFCTIYNLPSVTDDMNLDEVLFSVSESNSLHLGDRFFLQRIVDRINVNVNPNNAINVVLTIKNDAVSSSKMYRDIVVSLDWSAPMSFFPEEMIRLSLKEKGISGNVFNFKNSQKVIAFCPEIFSSKLRIFGLRKKFLEVLNIFKNEGFKVYYLGIHWSEVSNIYGEFVDDVVTGLEKCNDVFESQDTFAFLGFDNYWMHVASYKNKRCYVLQRRKFTKNNLLNHISSLNRVSDQNNKMTYL